jgi:hypothetical protein
MHRLILELFGLCAHPRRPVLRRNKQGRMGLECPDCFDWTPIEIDRSNAALAMARRQEVELWSRQPRVGFKLSQRSAQ